MTVETQQSARTPQAAPRAARLATATMFFVNGALFANWVVRIPAIQEKLELSSGELGVVLLGVPFGSMPTMPVTGWLVARYGSRPVTLAGALLMCLALPLPALAPNLVTLALALTLIGSGAGMLDVAMNAQGVVVEQHYRRPIMSSLHAFFSIGGLAGAAVGGLVAAAGVAPFPHLLSAALTLAIVSLVAGPRLLRENDEIAEPGPIFARPSRSLVGLAVIGFCVLLGEGAIADWSAVYLRRSIETGPGLAAAGYAVFSLAMAAGRLAGDRLTDAVGPGRLVGVGGLVAAGGLALAVSVAEPLAVLAGFAGVGAGLSFIFPIVLSAAARTPGMAPSVAIAAMSTTGYFGFLAGPPVIGFAAEIASLRAALGIVAVLSLLVTLLATLTTWDRPGYRD